MTPTQKTVTEAEYHECSSRRCPGCGKLFYIMASGWDVSLAVECPHCEELVKTGSKISQDRARVIAEYLNEVLWHGTGTIDEWAVLEAIINTKED